MCYQCEMLDGKFKNRFTVGRCLLCAFGLIFVVLIGIACGLLAFYLPDYIKEQELTKYSRLSDRAGQGSAKYVNYTECNNKDDLKSGFESSLVWKCDDQSCIPEYLRCSGYYDCEDKSDETDCTEYCEESVKLGYSFSCEKKLENLTNIDTTLGPANPDCYFSDFKCDGYVECPLDGEENDETNCDVNVQLAYDGGVVTCGGDNTQLCFEDGIPYCVPDSYRCDGYEYCINGEDELGCDDK